MTLVELMAELMKLDRTEVVTGLQTYAQPLYQVVFDKGHSTATTRHVTEKTTLEATIAGLSEQIRLKDEALKLANEKAPEIATLRQQHEAAIRDLQTKHEAKLKETNDVLTSERRDRAISELRLALDEAGVNPIYSEVLSLKPDVQKRIRITADGKREVLQADSEIPFAPAKGKSDVSLLAEELATTVPPEFVVSRVDRGSESRGGRGGGPAGATMYDKIRSDAEARQKTGTPKPLAERLGMTPSV
jgi:hypothetical protein